METKIDLKEEIRRLGIEAKFSLSLLEKDYHLTRILHKISEKKIKNLVFKGGTCLNKCYLGFYRLSEDLDFVYNHNIRDKSKREIKKELDILRREFIEILNELEFKVSNKLGVGWKMLTSKEEIRIVGLELL
jgi:predicted nucleotidyltransferase component of viral defense system